MEIKFFPPAKPDWTGIFFCKAMTKNDFLKGSWEGFHLKILAELNLGFFASFLGSSQLAGWTLPEVIAKFLEPDRHLMEEKERVFFFDGLQGKRQQLA